MQSGTPIPQEPTSLHRQERPSLRSCTEARHGGLKANRDDSSSTPACCRADASCRLHAPQVPDSTTEKGPAARGNHLITIAALQSEQPSRPALASGPSKSHPRCWALTRQSSRNNGPITVLHFAPGAARTYDLMELASMHPHPRTRTLVIRPLLGWPGYLHFCSGLGTAHGCRTVPWRRTVCRWCWCPRRWKGWRGEMAGDDVLALGLSISTLAL